MVTATEPEQAAREYVHLLLKMHGLDPLGKNESPELDSLCDELDGPWSSMNGRERMRVKGLSQDLYALAEGRRGIAMTSEQLQVWQEQQRTSVASGDADAQLAHLRQPFPEQMPADRIIFMQGHAWQRLGDLDVALVFMREAAKTMPTAQVAVVDYLRRLNRTAEAVALVDQVVTAVNDMPLLLS